MPRYQLALLKDGATVLLTGDPDMAETVVKLFLTKTEDAMPTVVAQRTVSRAVGETVVRAVLDVINQAGSNGVYASEISQATHRKPRTITAALRLLKDHGHIQGRRHADGKVYYSTIGSPSLGDWRQYSTVAGRHCVSDNTVSAVYAAIHNAPSAGGIKSSAIAKVVGKSLTSVQAALRVLVDSGRVTANGHTVSRYYTIKA